MFHNLWQSIKMGYSHSVEEEDQAERIAAYVNAFNNRQATLYVGSLQWQMRSLREEKKRLMRVGAQLYQVFLAHVTLQNETKAMIDTPQLEVKETRQSVYIVKQAHYNRLKSLDLSMPRFAQEKEFNVISEALTHCEEAYNVKCHALIQLRKKAKDDIVGMFEVYLILREIVDRALYDQEASSVPNIMHSILGDYYMRLIFEAVVLTNRHIVTVAFETLRTRVSRA